MNITSLGLSVIAVIIVQAAMINVYGQMDMPFFRWALGEVGPTILVGSSLFFAASLSLFVSGWILSSSVVNIAAMVCGIISATWIVLWDALLSGKLVKRVYTESKDQTKEALLARKRKCLQMCITATVLGAAAIAVYSGTYSCSCPQLRFSKF